MARDYHSSNSESRVGPAAVPAPGLVTHDVLSGESESARRIRPAGGSPSGTLVPYDITYYITLSFTVYDIIYDKSSL